MWITTPVSTADVVPTVLELTGTTAQDNVIGTSLCPELRGEERPVRAIPTFLSDNVDVHVGKHRIIRYRDGTTQFYNLSKDFWQQKNLGQGHRNYKAAENALYQTARA